MRLLLATVLVLCALIRTAYAVPEVCGNGVDDDADGYADEGCWPAGITGVRESPLSSKLTGDIAPKTGDLVYKLPPDLSPSVPYGPSLSFQRTYMSAYAPPATNYRTSLGARWHHNWMSWLDVSGSTVIVHLPTGQDVKFATPTVIGAYTYYVPQVGFHVTNPPTGSGSYLRQATSSPNNWELRTLTGEVYVYNWASPVGKLVQVKDTVGNAVTITYLTSGGDAGQIDRIDDTSGHKRLQFSYAGGEVAHVQYQTVSGGTPTTRVDVNTLYISSLLTSVTIAGTTIQTNAYTSSYLTSIVDGANNHIIDIAPVTATPAQTARVTVGDGGIGYEYASANPSCSGGTIMYFNLANTTSCSTDTDCGGTIRCGGKTGAGATGRCYRAARCLQVTSPSEDLITTVSPLTPCTGACAPTAAYAWDTSTGKLDLKGKKLADNNWTSYQRDSNGMVIQMAEGDTDNEATNAGGQKTWFFYDANFPGRVTEIRRQSDLRIDNSCNAGSTTTCKRTQYSWNSTTGLLDSRTEVGFTYNATNVVTSFSYTTGYLNDGQGRLTTVQGPLPGIADDLEYTYWSSADVFKDGYLNLVKQKKDASNYLITTYDDYDYWGNAGSQQDPDTTFTCRTFDANRGWQTQVREAMNGQTSCGAVDPLDLTIAFSRDTRGRLTRTTRPLGDCQHLEYDASGRVTNKKLRDDCVAANAGFTQLTSYDANGLGSKVEYKDAAGTVMFRSEGTFFDGQQLGTRINPVSTSYNRAYALNSDATIDTITFENSIGKIGRVWDAQNRRTDERRYNDAFKYDTWHFSYPATPTQQPNAVRDDQGKTVTTNIDDLGRTTRIVSPDSGTTLMLFDEASRMITKVEAYGLSDQVSHSYSYDYLGRLLSESSAGYSIVQYLYDSPPDGACPTCTNLAGRLAYAKSTFYEDPSDWWDGTFDQETYFGYDAGGRKTKEYIQDDSGRTATQSYQWDKNGNLTKVTAPSGVSMGYTLGSTGNSDANLVSSLWRDDGSVTNLLTNVAWAPLGPVTGYDQASTIGGTAIHASFNWNLAYRATQIRYAAGVTGKTQIDYSEDEKGRYTSKVYSNMSNSAIQSNYLTYDWLDRVICDAAVSGTCPTSGTNLKTKLGAFSSSNDRTSFRHQNPQSGDFEYVISRVAGTDKISSFTQTGLGGSTTFAYDGRGTQTSEDDSNSTTDRRDYTYDSHKRIQTITGKFQSGAFLRDYTVTSYYDQLDRRVFRSFCNSYTGATSQWYYYYDPKDRLIEVKFIPLSTAPTTYTIYQFYWLDQRPVAMFGTAFPGGTVSRWFMHDDEANRPIEVFTWPASGDSAMVWGVNPDMFGWDRVVGSSSSMFQPLRLNGAQAEDTTQAIKAVCSPTPCTPTVDRPPLITQRGITYDSLTEQSFQAAGRWPDESYTSKKHLPHLAISIVKELSPPEGMPKLECALPHLPHSSMLALRASIERFTPSTNGNGTRPGFGTSDFRQSGSDSGPYSCEWCVHDCESRWYERLLVCDPEDDALCAPKDLTWIVYCLLTCNCPKSPS